MKLAFECITIALGVLAFGFITLGVAILRGV